jgi:hypothetical protein
MFVYKFYWGWAFEELAVPTSLIAIIKISRAIRLHEIVGRRPCRRASIFNTRRFRPAMRKQIIESFKIFFFFLGFSTGVEITRGIGGTQSGYLEAN